MRFLSHVAALVCMILLAGCTLQSSVILPDAKAAGDPIIGFPSDAPFKVASFDRQTKDFKVFGEIRPEKAEAGRMRYTLVFTGESKKLVLQAKKLSDNNYVLRYAENGDGVEPNISDSALVFLAVEGDTYYVLTSLADKVLFEKAFPATGRPVVAGDTIKLETEAQGIQLSEFFRDHRAEFLPDQDYVRIRIAR